MTAYDVIVVGLGAMGSATLDRLAGRGVRALGIEQFGIPHEQGSSGGDSRLIRKAYFEHPDYVPLLERAYHNWRDLEADTGERVLHPTGLVYLGPEDGPLVSGCLRSAAAHGLTLEQPDAEDLAAAFPEFRRPEGYRVLYEPEGGFVLSAHAIRAFVARALDRGAEILTGERVRAWQATEGGVSVRTDRGEHRAAALVLTAGCWTAALAERLGVALTVTRQPLFWVRAAAPDRYALGRFPCWAVEVEGRPGLYYGFPGLPAGLAARLGTKLGHHAPGRPVAPDEALAAASQQELDEILGALEPFLPGLRGPMTATHVCRYTLSADEDFVIDRHPEHANVIVGCGFSGHGFKFASVIGEALADLATDGASALPIGFLARR